jgi:hypothetical protein
MSPAELREDCRTARQIALKEIDLDRKLLWAGHALALAQAAQRFGKEGCTRPKLSKPRLPGSKLSKVAV